MMSARDSPAAERGGLEAGTAQRAGGDVLGPGDVADAAMAERCEMIDREPHAGFVVGDDRRKLSRRRRCG